MHGDKASGLKRAHSLIMKVEADTKDDLVRELKHVIWRIRAGEITKGVMGGYSASNIYSYCIDPDITHDTYFEQIDAWLEQERDKKRQANEYSENNDNVEKS